MPAACFCMKLSVGMFISLLLVSWPSQQFTPCWVIINLQGYSLKSTEVSVTSATSLYYWPLGMHIANTHNV